MKAFTLAALAFVLFSAPSFAGEPVSFEQAYQNAKASGRPLVAVLGAEWCPACVVLKNQTIPEALRRGGLQDVELTHVNIDHQKKIAAKLQAGPMIPQVVKMQWTGKGWDIKRFPGVPNVDSVQAFAKTAPKKQTTLELAQTQEEKVAQTTKLIASVQ